MSEIPTLPQDPGSNAEICPHLGVEEDSQTCMAYPSPWNLCYFCRPVSAVRMIHQDEVCLSPAHTACPVFRGERFAPLPAQLRAHKKR